MVDFLLTQLSKAGLIQNEQVDSLNSLMIKIQTNPNIEIEIHGIEIHDLLEQNNKKNELNAVDFSILVRTRSNHEGHEENDFMHIGWLANELKKIFKSDGVWLEYDEEGWNNQGATKYIYAPLFYMPIQEIKTIKNISKQFIDDYISVSKEFHLKNMGKECMAPSSKEVLEWLQLLPMNWHIQQIGTSFRKEKLEFRVLLSPGDSKNTKQFVRYLDDEYIKNAGYIFDQILIAGIFPDRLSDLCGVEILNDSVKIDNLRSLRSPPRLKGSRLGKFMGRWKLENAKFKKDIIQAINKIEARQSKMHDQILEINMQGLSHIKIIYCKNKPAKVKAYVGNVCNTFIR